MKKNLRYFVLLLTCLLSSVAFAADVYTIYPKPQSQAEGTGTVPITAQVNVVCESGIDSYTRARLEEVLAASGRTWVYSATPSVSETNIYLGINASGGAADQMATTLGINRTTLLKADKFDRHFISLTTNGLLVLGEHTNAVFFGLASVEQMLEQPASDTNFPAVTIYDYADLQYRGVVEGYYGYPWTYEAKMDLMDFFKRYKMNTYIYGAKSDPYHTGYWDQAYPATISEDQHQRGWLTQDMIKGLSAQSLATKVDFIWAIHPGMATAVDFSTTANVDAGVTRVMNKFDSMHDLGVRQFAVFLDDCWWSVDYSDNYARFLTNIQNKLDTKYNVSYTNASDTVKPLHFVPSPYYIGSFDNATLSKYFGAIGQTDPKIVVYITGSGVWSRPSNATFQTMQGYLGRKAALWWNYPCNDNADTRLYMTDMLTTMSRMTAGNLGTPDTDFSASLGIASNPMQEGEVSKITLFGVADYCWNTAGFNSKKNWEASFPAIVGEDAAKALRYFADYGIYEDPDKLNTLFTTYKNEVASGTANVSGIVETMDSIQWCCTELRKLETSATPSDKLLYIDLKPWINKLYDMAGIVKGFVNLRNSTADDETRWNEYVTLNKGVNALSTSMDYVMATLEGTGTSAPTSNNWVQPSNKYTLPFINHMNENEFNDFFPTRAAAGETAIYTNATLPSTARVYTDATGLSYLRTTSMDIAPGQYVGVNFNQLQQILDMWVGDDTFASFLVQYSADGKNWTAYNKGDAAPTEKVAYIRFVNKTSETLSDFKMNKDKFTYTIPATATVSTCTVPDYSVYSGNKANLYDGDYNTFLWLDGYQKTGDAYTVTLSAEVPVYDVRICFGNNYDRPAVGRMQISTDGTTWTNLKVQGKTATSFTPSNLLKYSDEVYYLDFNGEGKTAKYVRLYVATAQTDRWMKIHEIEVNKQYMLSAISPIVTDATGAEQPRTIDVKAYTNYAPTAAGSLEYRFIQSKTLDEVRIFQDVSTTYTQAPAISITTDGSTWTNVGTLSAGITKIDMTTMPNATAMKITWTAGNAPTIYEITENGTDITDLVNSITSISGGDAPLNVTVNQGHISLASAVGVNAVRLYSLDGALLLSQTFAKATSAEIPNLTAGRGVAVMQVQLANGTTATYKVAVKE